MVVSSIWEGVSVVVMVGSVIKVEVFVADCNRSISRLYEINKMAGLRYRVFTFCSCCFFSSNFFFFCRGLFDCGRIVRSCRFLCCWCNFIYNQIFVDEYKQVVKWLIRWSLVLDIQM